MQLNQRTLIWGSLAVLTIVVAVGLVRDSAGPALIVAAVLALGVLAYAYSQVEVDEDDDEYDDGEGEEWGLPADQDDDNVDVDDRLSGFGKLSDPSPPPPIDDGPLLPQRVVLFSDDVEEEAEEAEEEYEYEYEEAEEEEVGDDAVPAESGVGLFSRGVIEVEEVKSDETILAAANVSSLGGHRDVLERQDANTETKQILSRVADLLAKYE